MEAERQSRYCRHHRRFRSAMDPERTVCVWTLSYTANVPEVQRGDLAVTGNNLYCSAMASSEMANCFDLPFQFAR